MNNLSLFLYFAEVLGRISGISLAMGLMSLGYFLIKSMFVGIDNDVYDYKIRTGEREKGVYPSFFKYVGGAFFFIMISALIPSTNTMYMIAGSEAGEMVVTSTEGKEILGDIKDVIRSQLDNLKAK